MNLHVSDDAFPDAGLGYPDRVVHYPFGHACLVFLYTCDPART